MPLPKDYIERAVYHGPMVDNISGRDVRNLEVGTMKLREWSRLCLTVTLMAGLAGCGHEKLAEIDGLAVRHTDVVVDQAIASSTDNLWDGLQG
jgi:hypothetical protein